MFLKNYRKNMRSLLTIFAVLITVIWYGADITTTDAQTTINNLPTRRRVPRRVPMDFTGDGRTDWATISYEPDKPIRWKILGNPASPAPNEAFIRIFDYGFFGDIIVPGDYTGDRKTDVAVYRWQSSPSIFYIAQFPSGSGGITLDRAIYWNEAANGDYDGDGKLDFTALQRNNGVMTWHILSSRTNTIRTVNFGNANLFGRSDWGADFTGDGRDELVYYTSDVNSNRIYYIGDAVTGELLITRQWGNSTTSSSLPFGDYTGDGKADFVLTRSDSGSLVWHILNPATNTLTTTQFGIGYQSSIRADFPVQGDYDGDGRLDIAVWRSSNRTFYVLRSSDSGLTTQVWGDEGDYPVYVGFFAIRAD